MDIIKHFDFFIKLFILGAVPWIFLSKENSLYFKIKNLKLSVIFNAFASLFATSVYICLFYGKMVLSKNYIIFFYWAIPLSIIYFFILFFFYQYVEEDGRKDTYFEIMKFKSISNKTVEQIKVLDELICRRNWVRFLVIIHFLLYILIFVLVAFGLGINSAVQFSAQ